MKMRISAISPAAGTRQHATLIIVALFLVICIRSSVSHPHTAAMQLRYVPGRRHHYCRLMISARPPPSPLVPLRLQRLRHCIPRPPPPPADEIDPRYGVDKRLVPSGPNPLHN